MWSCLGFRSSTRDDEREPLLPRYNDDTTLQVRLHEKLHTYQMLRALSQGYMPSNEQTIIHLRSLLSADILNPESPDLSPSGKALVRSAKIFVQEFIETLQNKNAEDEIQDFLWYLFKTRLNIDANHLGSRASTAKARADTTATYESLKTVGSLLLANSDFRLFLADLSTIGRDVFRDSAFAVANVSKQIGDQVDPTDPEHEALERPDNATNTVPSTEELQGQVEEVTQIVREGAVEVAHKAEGSAVEHFGKDERQTLAKHLKQVVLNLRHRRDYTDSVSTLSILLRRYIRAYGRAVTDIVEAAEEDVDTNSEAERAFQNFWQFTTRFGDRGEWKNVEKYFNKLVQDGKADPKFEELAQKLATMVQDMLSDPGFYDEMEKRFEELKHESKKLAEGSGMADDIESFLKSLSAATRSVAEDKDVSKLIETFWRIAHILSPTGVYTNGELVSDSINVFIPLLVQAIQHFPIPRLEVSTPAIDLLLENLILEPGKTVNNSSFFPYRLQVSTLNDVDVRKARYRTTSSMTSLMAIKISGLSLAADDLGYWFRLHSGIFRLSDEGLAGFHLDERGMDITIDVEIGRDRLEKIVSLRGVRVKIHHLTYDLRQSKFSWLAWLFKPVVRPIVKAALEVKIAAAISEGLHTLNRELLYARERLRAVRIADPDDVWTFVRAVAARLVPAPDPDLDTRVGVQPGAGIFRGRYAPGSLVQVWENEGREAGQRVYESGQGGWRNEIFDVVTQHV